MVIYSLCLILFCFSIVANVYPPYNLLLNFTLSLTQRSYFVLYH
jgi:hypothetical protein